MSTTPLVDELLAPDDLPARVEKAGSLGLATEDGVAELLVTVEELVHAEPSTAVELAMVCEAVGEPLDRGLAARARYLRARVLADRGEFEGALELIEQARADWCRTGGVVEALRTDLGRMHVLDDLGRHHETVEVGERLILELEGLTGTTDTELLRWLRAAALENLGVACGFIGQQERALECYRRAEAAYQELDMPEEVARPRANRGIELLQLGRGREALEALRSASDLFAVAGDRLWSAKCKGHIAEAHRQLGDPVRALRLLEEAEAALSELGATAESIRLRLAIAGTYLDLGLYDEALDTTTAVSEATDRLGMRHDTGTAEYLAGLACLGAHDPERAGTHLATAAAVFTEVTDSQLGARVRLAQAEVAAATGRLTEAAEQARMAAAELAAGGWLVPHYWATLRLVDLCAPDQTSEHLDEARELLERLPVAPLRYPYLIRAARQLRDAGRVDECELVLRSAIDVVDQVSASLPDHLMRTAYRADRAAAYDELVVVLAGRDDDAAVTEAATIADQAKARTLVDLLAGAVPVDEAGGGTAELREIRADLNATYSSLLEAGPNTRPDLLARAEDLERRTRAAWLRAAPVRSGGTGTTPGPRTTAEVPTLSYHVVGDDAFAFVEDAGGIRCTRLAGVLPEVRLSLERLASQWQRLRLQASLSRAHSHTFVATANDVLGTLHRLLVQPVEDHLNDIVDTDLVVVPHRVLGQVPFHALHDGSGHLVDRWAISVAPTSSMLPSRHDRSTKGRSGAGGALVLAVPDRNTPSVAVEAAAIDALLPDTTLLLGDEATLDALRAHTPGPSYIHVACHGLYRPTNPLFSSLRLADGWSTAAQVLDLDLRGALVTLSACESGRRDDDRPEPVGLSWAFLAAGASGVVVSQWIVDDAVTLQLMTELYRGLAAGRSPAHALRDAQLATAARHPHPFHWAPFTFVSSTASVPPKRHP